MSPNPDPSCTLDQPLRGSGPDPRAGSPGRPWAFLALRGLATAMLAAASGGALAQALPPASPGLWQFWRTDSARAPNRPADLTICVDAAGARDPALMVGQAPGDASCEMRGLRRVDGLGLDATLSCPGGRLMKASVRFSSPNAFVTQLEHTSGPARGGLVPGFVHARRVAECTR